MDRQRYNDTQITLNLIEQNYEKAIGLLQLSREKSQSERDKYLISKIADSLKILRLEINKDDTYATDMLSKIATAVTHSKAMREMALDIDKILRDYNTVAIAEVKTLHSTMETILGKEDEIMALRRQVKAIQKDKEKAKNQSLWLQVIILLVVLIALIIFAINFLGAPWS